VKLEDRAHRAADDVRAATAALDEGAGFGPEAAERFHRSRERRQRNARIGVILVASVVAIAGTFFVVRAIPRAEQPAGRPIHNGRIVFGRSAPGVDETRLFTVNPDGTGEVSLPVSFTDCAEWSPDGTKLHITASAYPGSRLRPAVINADGTGFTLLNGTSNTNLNLGCGDWTPDMSRLVLQGFPETGHPELNGIYSVRASDGGDLTLVSRNPFGGYDAVPQVSPDGTSIVFLRNDPSRHLPGFEVGALYVVGLDGTGQRRITPWGEARGTGSWSPDGRWIAFAGPPHDLYLVHPDGSGLVRIPVDLGRGKPVEPRWSPDGTMLVFGLQTNGQSDIYTVRTDGSDLTQITNTPTIDERWPDWGAYAG
jgi:WD40 repeat protein